MDLFTQVLEARAEWCWGLCFYVQHFCHQFWTVFQHHLWHQMCGVSPSHQPVPHLSRHHLGVLHSILILTLTVWSEYTPHRLRAPSLETVPTPDVRRKSLASSTSHCPHESRLPTTPSSHLVTCFDQWLIELRGTLYLFQFIIKDFIKDTNELPDEEVHKVRGLEVSWARTFLSPWSWAVPLFQWVTAFTSLEASLCKPDWW